MTVERIRKRQIIAVGLVLGLKVAYIARELGVSRSWASREAHSAGVRDLIADAIWKHRELVEVAFVEAVQAIRESFAAHTECRRGRRILHGGPDYKVRMEAVSVFISLLETVGRTPVPIRAYRNGATPA
jgi:hypothetical protein